MFVAVVISLLALPHGPKLQQQIHNSRFVDSDLVAQTLRPSRLARLSRLKIVW